MRDYANALFPKVCSIDPSIKDRNNATDSGVMHRIGN